MGKRNNKQDEIYNFIKQQISIKGYPPSVREICSAVNLSSTSTVHGHLKKLEQRGLIRRDKDKTRAIEIINNTETKNEMLEVPIVGKIAAGQPILATENIEGFFAIPTQYVHHNSDLFILKVSGVSMIDAGILDGDLAIIEKCNSAENGEIVAALIESEATLKTFYKEKDHVRLQPENPTLNPIIVEDCQVLGKLVGIYRQY